MPNYEANQFATGQNPDFDAGAQYGKTAIHADQRPGPFGHAAGTFERVSMLAARVQSLSDRLLGGAGLEETGSQAQRPPNGVFDALDMTCSQIDAEIAAANAALSRIENSLP